MSDRMEFHVPATDESALSDFLRLLTCLLQFEVSDKERGGGFLGGSFGYGVDFENGAFLMHHYCWCEKDDCLWCGGSSCQGDIRRNNHSRECYQFHLKALKMLYGEKESWGWYVRFDHKEYAAAKKQLCLTMGLDVEAGNEVHCTCGSDADWRRRYDACQCDWHLGNGTYRFGAASSAPNFWHKDSGLKVNWYKYIGRSMEIEGRGDSSLESVALDCVRSIGYADLDSARLVFEEAQKQDAEDFKAAMQFWGSAKGQALSQELIDTGVVQVLTFGGKKPSDDDEDLS